MRYESNYYRIKHPFIISLPKQQNSTIASNDVKPQDSIQNIGGQTDEHGCYIAAGYTWSQLKNDCIRLFEDGIALENLNTTDTYHTAAYLRQLAEKS